MQSQSQAHLARSGSVPRDYKKITRTLHDDRFKTLEQAAQLAAQLRALDAKLAALPVEQHRDLDLDDFLLYGELPAAAEGEGEEEGERPRVRGTEAAALLVILDRFPRPDLIPRVYVDAYRAALHGRPFVNEWNVSNFCMGRDPTCSAALAVLHPIDNLLETSLRARFDAADAAVPPFAFLRLPAELRRHVYSYLFPRDGAGGAAALALPPSTRILRQGRDVRIHLDMLRVNRQLYDEVTRYFYHDRPLSMSLYPFSSIGSTTTSSSSNSVGPFCPRWQAHYCKTLTTLPARTRAFFRQLHLHLPFPYTAFRGPPQPHSHFSEPTQPDDDDQHQLDALCKLLVNLVEVRLIWPTVGTWSSGEVERKTAWVRDRVPENVQLRTVTGV